MNFRCDCIATMMQTWPSEVLFFSTRGKESETHLFEMSSPPSETHCFFIIILSFYVEYYIRGNNVTTFD